MTEAWSMVKSKMAKAQESQKQILETNNAFEIKQLGKLCIDEKWSQIKAHVMFCIDKIKYNMNMDFGGILNSTGGRPIIEFVRDLFWGIGFVGSSLLTSFITKFDPQKAELIKKNIMGLEQGNIKLGNDNLMFVVPGGMDLVKESPIINCHHQPIGIFKDRKNWSTKADICLVRNKASDIEELRLNKLQEEDAQLLQIWNNLENDGKSYVK
uniref:NADAR domain-containing protein n=1 Tax=Romanomermis culicivorax TaxID=13658 RepID=A0A915L710_ROMCU